MMMVEGIGMSPVETTVTYNTDGTFLMNGSLQVNIQGFGAAELILRMEGTWSVQASTSTQILIRRVGTLEISSQALGVSETSDESGVQPLAILGPDSFRDEDLTYTRVR